MCDEPSDVRLRSIDVLWEAVADAKLLPVCGRGGTYVCKKPNLCGVPLQ
jgi:hypothetical protein